MRKVVTIIGLISCAFALVGCAASDQGVPPPAGDPPKAKQADPGMKTPEERAREAGGGGEGS